MENPRTPLIDEDHKGNSCPLCNIPDREVLAEFPRWKLARTKDHETTQRAAHALPQKTREDDRRAVYRRGIHATLDDRPQILLPYRPVGRLRTSLRHRPRTLAPSRVGPRREHRGL